jgi:3-phosphoshikimate 1-carboxyvinyltransferase
MRITISPSVIAGSVQAPASKSSMQRACAAALVSQGRSIIKNPGRSNDDLAALGVIRDLGATTTNLPDGSLQIDSHGVDPVSSFVHCGESGLGIRMFAPLAALGKTPIVIEGEGSLLRRPMDFFDSVFPQLKVEVLSNRGKLPLQLKGPLQPADIETDGSLSSQFLTGLLMAYAAADAKGVTIRVHGLRSRPYIDLTLKVMRDFGLKVPENRNYEFFYFSPEPALRRTGTIEYIVEGDWSGGSFLLVAGAVAGNIQVSGLDPDSTQADKAVLTALEKAGTGKLRPFDFDATDCPDLFPPLVALASLAEGSSFIRGVGRLAHKESDRSLTLQEEFGKLGVTILLEGDCMEIKGTGRIRAAAVDSHGDHRIAMACAVAALRADGPVLISGAEAIGKSYPSFFDDLKTLGASVHELSSTY